MKTGLTLWAGCEESFEAYQGILKKLESPTEVQLSEVKAYNDRPHPEQSHWMLEMQGDLAIVNVNGPMVQGSVGFWGSVMGYVGYSDIIEAYQTALSNGATKFLTVWDTGGGSVAGIYDTSQFLTNLSNNFDTVAYTSNLTASAGVWLSTTANEFYAAPMAQVGSIGVIATHTEYTKMLEDQGITKTVFRSVPGKALGTPFEKLSEAAVKNIEEDIAVSHEFFVSAIAENTGIDRKTVSSDIATGKLWYAQDALDNGLLTGLATLNQVFVDLKNKKSDNTATYKSPNKKADTTMKSKKLSVEAAAAIQAGIPPEQVLAEIPDAPTGTEANEPTPAPEASDNANCVDKPDEVTKPTESLMDQLINAKVDLATTKAALENATKGQADLKSIVVNHLLAVNTSLGLPTMTAGELMAIDTSALVSQHAASSTLLSKRYGTGGRVSLPAADAAENDDAAQAQASIEESEQEFIRLQNLKLARTKR
jgi:signal peptide peptidase SppA